MQFSTIFTVLASAAMATAAALPAEVTARQVTPAPFNLNLFYGPGAFNTNFQVTQYSIPLLAWYNLGCQFDSCSPAAQHTLTSVLVRRGATELAADVACTFYEFGTADSQVPGQCSGRSLCVKQTVADVGFNAGCVRCTPGSECPRGI
ncbi:hypothetical protein BJ508DRAFT_360645 [Ascobolus immersus RN42]|uniref:Uncharacterized protein n=1 Tax=Ascobolus immersus RN42 TaxID=1160509 RepID=A0A3N4IAT9_ASCIM|nr:hypothetical protein BJ508DRAFT_360645 [Ascobolus immersus RN42]